MWFLLGAILGAQIIILIKLCRMEYRIVERGDTHAAVILKHISTVCERLEQKMPSPEKKGKKSKP